MAEIIPAILETTYTGFVNKLEQLVGLVDTVQLDICDGVFVPTVSWPYTAPMKADEPNHYDEFMKDIIVGNGDVDMPMWEDFDFELDLMIADPKRLLPDLLTIGPSRIIFHYEAFTDLHTEIYDIAKTIPPLVEVGIAINVDTNPEVLFPLIDQKIFKFVQCMGIDEIGKQGQSFDAKVFENINILRDRYPDLPIAVDGAVNLSDAKLLVESGATRLVAGSAIFSAENIADRVAEFTRVVQ
ncbi:MAG: hypothetical protein WCO65_03485 [bacterium]